MAEVMGFQPEKPLRYLGYHKLLGKTRPPETLYWHCLNTFHAARKIVRLLPIPLNAEEERVLAWSALLHDAGKEGCWQQRGHGPHTPEAVTEVRIRALLGDPDVTQGQGPQSAEELELIIELIREHHTRRTASNADIERILAVLKLADAIVSAQSVDASVVDKVARFLQPHHRPLVLSAEQHPISHFALSVADQEAANVATLLLANGSQSLYLLPEGMDVDEFKRRIVTAVGRSLVVQRNSGSTLKKIYSWVSEGPIRDFNTFLQAVHGDRNRVAGEILRELDSREKRIEARRKRGDRDIDEREFWFGPFRVLYHATRLADAEAKLLMGTEIPLVSLRVPGSPLPIKDAAEAVARQLGCRDPRQYIERVLQLIVENSSPLESEEIPLDVFTWSDAQVDATQVAEEAYALYRETQWNSRTRRRDTSAYCFSCRRRRAARPAPSGGLPTDTWTSAAAKKGKVSVCPLCFIAQAYVLPQTEPGRFHIDATPAYNQARLDWERVFWEGCTSRQFVPHQVSAHHIVLPLARATTPNEALVEALGFTLEFQFGTTKEYRAYADLLYLHGLHGAIGAGPQHPGPYTLSGGGIRVKADDWEDYGAMMKVLKETHPQKVFPANHVWRALLDERWSWGTMLAVRHRRGRLKPYHVHTIQELIRLKLANPENTILGRARTLPLYTADRDERFKAAESVLRRMDQVARRAAKDPSGYGGAEGEVVERIAELGMKQLRSRIQKNARGGAWRVNNERLMEVQEVLNALATELWRLRDQHTARQDFLNATIMAMAYNPRKEED